LLSPTPGQAIKKLALNKKQSDAHVVHKK